MIPAPPLDVAQQEEVPDGEGRCEDVAATHDERERPRHRLPTTWLHVLRMSWPTREADVGRRYLMTIVEKRVCPSLRPRVVRRVAGGFCGILPTGFRRSVTRDSRIGSVSQTESSSND